MKEKQTVVMASVKEIEKKKKKAQYILEAFCNVIQCEVEGEGNQVKET